ncbi:MAG: DUF2309 domain-containing protein [Polaromonas sp.]
MNATLTTNAADTDADTCTAVAAGSPLLSQHIAAATQCVAPTWPLDEFIAVNPYWGWVGQSMEQAASRLGTLAGTRLTMPRDWFAQQWAQGLLQRRHLEQALRAALPASQSRPSSASDAAVQAQVQALVTALQGKSAPLHGLALLTDLRDAGAPPRWGQSWSELVTHQVSQHCAAFFDRCQASWQMDTRAGLYGSWREQLAADHGLPWPEGRAALKAALAALPPSPHALIGAALDALGIAEEGRQAYLSAALMAIGGWAAWCAHERWQAGLRGQSDDTLTDLLAIRLAWEWLLHASAPPGAVPTGWATRWSGADEAARVLAQAQRTDWLLQSAVEIAYREPLIAGLSQPPKTCDNQTPMPTPAVQAVFCIDVRSERLRRALEAVSPQVQTRGFAGFFGLPIAYSPLGSALSRPQLPGLLSPACEVTEASESAALGQVLAGKRRQALQWRQRWAEFRAAPASTFSFVESMGLLYGAKLVADSLPRSATQSRWEDTGLPPQDAAGLRPCLAQVVSDPAGVAVQAKAILTAMGMVGNFAPLVLLAGHGSQSANNPHAAGLDCGACGGQSGEVNARVLADMLNAPAVREQLGALGMVIGEGTHFLPGLHNTTTDEVVLYDVQSVPAALQPALQQLRGWLEAAGERTRAERAASLGLAALAPHGAALKQSLRERGNDWAQVRPEWGLANNAAFIVAPRTRSQHLNLDGRSFLHDYDHRLDLDLKVLTLIMTAPMVVTNWINMQYHASTVDNRRYGSGNKVLHNVVGGRLGVFEGNGGDLRIGLPMQSLHDGQALRHTPLRLSVFIEAPPEAIDRVMATHDIVRQLVDGGWLHLFCMVPQSSAILQRRQAGWASAALCIARHVP